MADPAAFSTSLDVRWRDLDAFNHVNNATYLSFLEEARIRWFARIGEEWLTSEYAPVLAQTTLNYKVPVQYPARVSVELFTERLGNSSVTVGHRIVGEDGTLHCDGNVVCVWIDLRSGKPRPLPEGVRRASEALLQAS